MWTIVNIMTYDLLCYKDNSLSIGSSIVNWIGGKDGLNKM